MTVAERKKQLRIVNEILTVHLPDVLNDQELARDLLAIVGVALRAAWEDVQRSTEAWDKRHYHVRADRLRDDWIWALAAANTAEGLAYREPPVTVENLERLQQLIQMDLERPRRRVIKNPETFRGAARANLERQKREKSSIPKRSMV